MYCKKILQFMFYLLCYYLCISSVEHKSSVTEDDINVERCEFL